MWLTDIQRVSQMVCGLVLASIAATAGAFDRDSYTLVYHQSGKLESSYVQGSAKRSGRAEYATAAVGGFSIFTGNGLYYFVERDTLTIYRPGEGMYVVLRIDPRSIGDDVDGTRVVDFSRARGVNNASPRVILIRHPDVIGIWDRALKHPEGWLSSFGGPSGGRTHFNNYKGDTYYLTGITIPVDSSGKRATFEAAENFLSRQTAAAAKEDIVSVRAHAAQADNRQAQKDAAKEARAQQAQSRLQEIASQAERRFQQAVSTPKSIGATVCSADNRIAYIEQMAGPRIKLTLRARAVGSYREFGEFGPYDIVEPDVVAHGNSGPIRDANFLYHPLSKQVRISSLTDVIWDESRYWGVCDYR